MEISKNKLILALLLASTLSTAIAVMIITRTFTVTISVIPHLDLKLWADSAGTIPLTSMALGEVYHDGEVTKTFYLQNTDEVDLLVSLRTDAPVWLTVTWNRAESPGNIIETGWPASSYTTTITFRVASDAPFGDFGPITVFIDAQAAP